MSEPTTWENLPMSQDDSRTIGQFIADSFADHNSDSDAHMDAGASLASHREQETLDHPELSVAAVHIADDVPDVAPKAGVLPAVGTSWTAASSMPTFLCVVGAYCAAGSGTYIAVANDGHVSVSADGDSWSNGTSLPSGTYTLAAASPDMAVVGGTVSGGVCLQYSVDGTSWTACSGFLGEIAYSLLWDGTQFVASCHMSAGQPHTYDVFTSSDGITWAAKGSGLNAPISGMGYDGSAEYRGFEYFNSTFYISSDLATWSTVNVNPRDFLFTNVWSGQQWLASGENVDDTSGFDVVTAVSYVAQATGQPSRSAPILGNTWNASAAVDGVAFMLQGSDSYGMAIANPQTAVWTYATLPDGFGANAVFGSSTRLIGLGNTTVTGTIFYSVIPA